jgi:hypothetical protein
MLTLTVLVLLGAEPSAPPPPPPLVEVPGDPVRVDSPQRNVTLLDDQPSQSADLVGRALMAPVLGVAGGGIGFGVGVLLAVAGAGSNIVGALLGVVVGGLIALVAFPAGVAVGASLFSTRFGELFLELPLAVSSSWCRCWSFRRSGSSSVLWRPSRRARRCRWWSRRAAWRSLQKTGNAAARPWHRSDAARRDQGGAWPSKPPGLHGTRACVKRPRQWPQPPSPSGRPSSGSAA